MNHIPTEERLAQIVDLVQAEMPLLPNDQVRKILVGRLVRLVFPNGRIQEQPAPDAPAGPVPMEDQEADRYGRMVAGFGRFKGQRYRDIPRDYLEWLADQKRDEWQALHRYLNAPARLREDEQALETQDWPEHHDSR